MSLRRTASLWAAPFLVFLTLATSASAQPAPTPQSPAPSEDDAAAAPERHRFSLGLSAGTLLTNKDGLGGATFGGVFRWRGRNDDGGWGPSFEFGSFQSTIDATIGGQRRSIARIKVRALMGGIEYELRRGNWSYEMGVVGGWSFNDIDPEEQAAAGISAEQLLDVDVSGSIAFGPTFTLWYDIPKTRLAFTTTADYSITRPEVAYRTDRGSFSQREWLTGLALRAGIAVGLF